MTRDEIMAFFPPALFQPSNLGAASYAVPTLAWLRGPFWDAFRADLWSTNDDKWKVRWECRDFARYYASLAQRCWSDDANSSLADDGIAVGEIWFIPDAKKPNEGHAICPCFTEQGLVYIDPQNNTPWALTPEQFSSRYFLRF